MFKDSLVDIPDDKGVHVKLAGSKGEKYVYKHIEYFRDSNGKPRNKSKIIGKLDINTGKMLPNINYFNLYKVDFVQSQVSVWDYGYTYLIFKVCEDIGLSKCLFKSFGSQSMEIIAMAAYIIREGGAMDGIDDWQARNYIHSFEQSLTSQSSSRAFASITEQKRQNFFKLWIATSWGGDSVCYDVTSISSYAKQITDVEYGYNRDGDNLPQFNLGMFCDETTKIPLFYSRYSGSLTDKVNLSYVLASAKELGLTQVKMIMDGGFWDKDCIQNLHSICDSFIIGMPAYLNDATTMIDQHACKIESYSNELTYKHIYCVQSEMKFHGVLGRVLIYFDSMNHVKLCEELSERIEALKFELSKLKRYPKSKLKRYTSLFDITKHENDSGFDYVINLQKVEELRKYKGFFLLFSTDMDLSPSDVLYYYRSKDVDEKLFAQIKVDMECERFRTHNAETSEGKAFVTFIACVIRAYMLNKLANYLSVHSTSMKKTFNQLSNIIAISSSSEGKLRFTKAITKKQREILETFNAYDSIFENIECE